MRNLKIHLFNQSVGQNGQELVVGTSQITLKLVSSNGKIKEMLSLNTNPHSVSNNIISNVHSNVFAPLNVRIKPCKEFCKFVRHKLT